MSLFVKQILLFSLLPISLFCFLLPLHHFHSHTPDFPHNPTFSNSISTPPRISYFITGTKNDGPRIFRLLQAIYHPRNYYLLHLDQFASTKQRLNLALQVGSVDVFVAADNVNVIEKADAVNEQGSSPLSLVLHGVAILLKWKKDWDWFVNLDASDYPLIKQDDFLHILSFVPRNLNFIEYNKNVSPEEYRKAEEVIVDSRLYINLKGKMFVGDRKRAHPSAFNFFMGSQHVILNRKFVEYSIHGWENLPRLLLLYFTNTRSSHKGYFQTLACNTKEFLDAVINSNLRFTNSDNSDRILKREVAFVGNISEDSPLLDMIDAHILHRGRGMVSPGGWCLGSSNWFSDPCGEWGDPSVLRPGPTAQGLEKLLMKSIKDMSIRSSRCDHQ
ncbi:beta-glucuronosyltransferase GlcAT14B-like [Lycium barbarum]|uniref:beta-glucuronosyltransferase GlcAT14B-like n=1 Tax=Lycium barbarum TaxID=112863 RepID=UPI00293E3732|nr:beta-glucuronosyltransferase GlcAT14B-like [Lycium barbarum]